MKIYKISVIFLIIILAKVAFTDETGRSWMLDEHTRISLDVMNEWKYTDTANNKIYNWTNNELKFIVLSANLLTDMWDKGQFLTENLFDGMRLSEIFVSISSSVYKNKKCKNSVPDILRQSQDYTEYFNEYIEDSGKGYFNYYPDPKNRDDGGLSRTKGFHFDNLFSFNEIKIRWEQINNWLELKAKSFKKIKGIKKWFVLIGLILHAVQDFYCHSNWVLISAYEGNEKKIDVGMLPTWDDIYAPDSKWIISHSSFQSIKFRNKIESNVIPSSSEFLGRSLSGLQTGNCKNVLIDNKNCQVCECDNFSIPTIYGKIAPWGHRHPGDEKEAFKTGRMENIRKIFRYLDAFNDEYIAAIELSKRASLYWLEKMLNPNVIGKIKFKKILDTINTKNDIIEDSFTGCEVDYNEILEKFNKVYPTK